MDVLYKAALKEQRLPLSFAFQDVKVSDNIQHGLLAAAKIGTGDEVAGDAIREAKSLADVQNRPRSVLHEVHARDPRKGTGFFRKPPNSVNSCLHWSAGGQIPWVWQVRRFRNFRCHV